MQNIDHARLFDVAKSKGTDVLFETLIKGEVVQYRANQIDENSDRLAMRLIESDVEKGDYILTLLKDGPNWNITENAILKTGGVHVPLSQATDSQRLVEVISALRPKIVIVETATSEKRVLSLGVQSSKDVKVINVTEELGLEVVGHQSTISLRKRKDSVNSEDVAVVLFTSGTTSIFKGVLLSHRNVLIASCEFGKSDAFSGVARTLSVLPMSHSAARKVNYACQLNGVIVCYAAPSLSTFANINRFQVQHFATVPYMLQALRNELELKTDITSPLKKVNCGGASLPASLWNWFEHKQIKVYEVYGLTETASLLSYSTDDCRRPNCVGKKAKNIEYQISENGELEVSGPTLLKGYIQEDGAITQAVDEYGWFGTGDAVVVDSDGGFKIIGRLNRSYKSQRGSHIFPEELEHQLVSLKHIEQAFLVNNPHESLRALILLSRGSTSKMAIESIRNYNKTVNDDLVIEEIAILEHSQLLNLNLKGQLKPNSFTLNKVIKNSDFIKV